MTWLVFGVSCLLVLAGAVSIISGAPIIQLERGWAEVIAGTVALSSGGVVFALAGILMRLESLRDAMAATAVPAPIERFPAPPPPTSLAHKVEALPPVPPAGPEPMTEPPLARAEAVRAVAPLALPVAPVEDKPQDGLWKQVKRPAETADPDDLREHGFPDRVTPDEPAPGEKPVLVPAHKVPPSPSGPPPYTEPTIAPEPVAPETGQIGWLERSLFKTRTAVSEDAGDRAEPRFPANRGDAGRETRLEPSLAPLAPRLFDTTPEPSAAAEPIPTPDLASEQHQSTTVIGRYQAGSASYVMYSDGTIEVETDGGEMHRFGSMDELKAFIAKQDTAVS